MRVIPVLDLQGGHIVRGVGGRRAEYRPLISLLTPSSQPVAVARAIRTQFGFHEVYLADLDALTGAAPALETYIALRREGFALWVDAGLRDAADAAPLTAVGIEVLIAGLETLHGPEELAELVRVQGPDRILFSLDLKDGVPLGDLTRWRHTEPAALAGEAAAAGVRRVLVLDLGRVGVGNGTGTEELCARLAVAHPEVCLAAGGGVRGPDDLRRLAGCGVQAVLVASAVHDGRLRREHLQAGRISHVAD